MARVVRRLGVPAFALVLDATRERVLVPLRFAAVLVLRALVFDADRLVAFAPRAFVLVLDVDRPAALVVRLAFTDFDPAARRAEGAFLLALVFCVFAGHALATCRSSAATFFRLRFFSKITGFINAAQNRLIKEIQ